MKLMEKWQRDLTVYRDVYTTFIVEGNIHDKQTWVYEEDDYCQPVSLEMFMYMYLKEEGYDVIAFYNTVDGFYNTFDDKMLKTFNGLAGVNTDKKLEVGVALGAARTALNTTGQAVAVVITMANTLALVPDSLSDDEASYYSSLMLTSMNPTLGMSGTTGKPLTNLIFMFTDKINDIPAWFYLNNPHVKTLTISKPGKDIRKYIISSKLNVVPGTEELTDSERDEYTEQFALLTDGMSLVELDGVITLCRQQNIDIKNVREAVYLYRYGQTESYWDKIDINKIQNIEAVLKKRVKGQEQAVAKVADIISRASLGLSSLQGNHGKPKGVLFFAGPTGTGKTELAKSIAEYVFGDEAFMIRFDMSEYGQSHSDQKLLGAPPGYVGYSAGGQLTNAIKEKPFSVVLFDEIEKAHPSILDKFLQILEDGRLTDSAGETVYFSETLIIFTSNLGINSKNKYGELVENVNKDMPYDEMRERVLASIQDYFKFQINRPEILNRIGDNFVVFNYINEKTAMDILSAKITSFINKLRQEKNIQLYISANYSNYLLSVALGNLDNGGRGIGNVVETYLVNPLARVLTKERANKNIQLMFDAPPSALGELPKYRVAPM